MKKTRSCSGSHCLWLCSYWEPSSRGVSDTEASSCEDTPWQTVAELWGKGGLASQCPWVRCYPASDHKPRFCCLSVSKKAMSSTVWPVPM